MPCFLASCLKSWSLSICKNWSGIPSGSSVKYSGKSKAKLAVNRDFAIGTSDIQLSYSPSSLIIYCKWTGPPVCHSYYKEKFVWENEDNSHKGSQER